MSRKIINCLYSYFKNSPKKLKIICDWDEVIQCLEPFALYLALRKNKSAPPGLKKLAKRIIREKVYQLCSQIPEGKVSTYKIIAQFAYGSANYARRVGTLLGRCPDCMLYPNGKPFPAPYDCPWIHCYRVIRSDFHIGGFLGGFLGSEFEKLEYRETKKWELGNEGIFFDNQGYLLKEFREKVIFKDFDFNKIEINEFSLFFETFWKSNLVDYSPHGSKMRKINKQQIEIKNSPDFYQKALFLTIAKELLMLIKAKKVEKLIFLTAYDKRKFPKGDFRKLKIFQETFGKFSNCFLQLIGFDSDMNMNQTQGKTKADWIKENAVDFDVIIDDNPLICKSIVEDHNSKINVCAPYYPSVIEKHHSNVVLVKTSISNLEKNDNDFNANQKNIL